MIFAKKTGTTKSKMPKIGDETERLQSKINSFELQTELKVMNGRRREKQHCVLRASQEFAYTPIFVYIKCKLNSNRVGCEKIAFQK